MPATGPAATTSVRPSGGDAPAPPPVERPKLRTNLLWTLLSSAASAAGNWLLVVVLARSSGSVAVGSYALALALTAPVIGSGSLTGFQLRTLVASDPTHRYSFREYRWASILGDVIGILIMGVVVQLAPEPGSWQVMIPVVAMRAAETLGEAYFGLWQVHERMKVLAIARVLQGAVAVALAIVLTQLGLGAAGAALAGAAGCTVSVAYLHLALHGHPDVRAAAAARDHTVTAGREWHIVREGVPLGVVVLLGVLQTNIPRYFIERHAGQAALGLFAAASQLTTAGNMIVAAVSAAAMPRLAAWSVSGDRSFWTTTLRLTAAAVALGAAGISLSALFGREILGLLYGAEFTSAHHTLVVLSVSASLSFVCAILGLALTAARIITPQGVVLAVTLVALTFASAWLVPLWGQDGAAWALVVALAIETVGFAVILARLPRRGAPLNRLVAAKR